MKRLTICEYQKLGFKDLVGRIVEFKDSLFVYFHEKMVMGKWQSILPKFSSREPVARFMKVNGGFGSCFACSGRMLSGIFYQTFDEALKDDRIQPPEGCETGGSTKEAPDWVYIDDLEVSA